MNVTLIRYATVVIVGIVVLAGGIVTIIHPDSLPFTQYIHSVAIGAGLLGIGHGLDSNSTP